MKKKPDPEMIDDENPEWTREEVRTAMRFSDLPLDLQKVLKSGRGQQKAPTKEQITIRLSKNVLTHFRETGKGWQTRIDEALQEIVKQREAA
ncbi:MAG: BrnA antitoxin family protein [Alistipes senegalensis]|nr:BrnA antitoxin family protein [Oxalobacter formigenes]MCM1280683.1 BrnA antitoxin family protein [Alistipes senegalensis]